MLGSVGGLVEVISKVVDNVGASDAEVVLETVEGYVTRSLMRFVVLVCSVDISIKNVVLSVVVDIVIVVVEMVPVAELELKISVVEYAGVVGDNVVLVCSEMSNATSAAIAFINGVVLVVLELGIVDDSAIVVVVEVVIVLVCVKGVGETVVEDDRVTSAATVVEVVDTELGVIADVVVEGVAKVEVVGVLVIKN